MTDLLSPEQRQALAELAGLKRGGPEGWEPDYYNDNKKIICPITKWLSGDLTNEAAYYQIHLVLEGVRAKGMQNRFCIKLCGVLGKIHWALEEGGVEVSDSFNFLCASPLAIAKAALEVLKDE